MRQILIILIFSFAPFTFMAQAIKLKDIEKIKAGELLVGLSGNEQIDGDFKMAIEKFWTFKEVAAYLPFEEAVKRAKKHKGVYVLYIGLGKSIGPPQGQPVSFESISATLQIKISSGKFVEYAHLMPEVYTYIPVSGSNDIRPEVLFFGIAALQHLCDVMVVENIKSTMKWKAICNRYSDELKEKTLYLLDDWIKEGLSADEIKKIYPYPIKVVSYNEWSYAINTFQKDIAYCMVVPVPRAGDYLYVHYLMLASEPKVLGTAYPMVTTSVMGASVTATNSGYINKKNIKAYWKLVR